MISVVTACKNIISDGRENFFRKMMDSLHGQTYQDFEHIVIDGQSTDGTVDLLRSYQNEGYISHLTSEPDRNLYEAMNKGVRMAQGDVVHIMNSDDYLTNTRFFEILLESMENNKADFTHADRTIEARDGTFIGKKCGDERSAYFRMPFRHQTMLIKKEVYDDIGSFDEKYDIAADYKFMMKMLLGGRKGYYIPEVFIHSLDGGISSSRAKVISEVSRVIFESYGMQYGLTELDCQDIYLRQISPGLHRKINTNVSDERIKSSLQYCYELSTRPNIENERPVRGRSKES